MTMSLVLLATKVHCQDILKGSSISGFCEVDHISYFKTQSGKINDRNQTILDITAQSIKMGKVGYYANIEFRTDASDSQRERLFLNEGYCKYKTNKLDVNFGVQIIEWGMTDRIKPTDNISPIDYSDFIDTEDERLGVFALNTKYYLSGFELQTLLIPEMSIATLPQHNSRWFINKPEMAMAEIGVNNYTVNLTPGNKNKGVHNSQFGFQASKSMLGWDFALNYYYGYNHFAEHITALDTSNLNSINLNINEHFYKQQIVGASFAHVFGKFNTRTDIAYFIPEGPINTDEFLRFTFGVDRQISVGYNNLLILAQWMQEVNDNADYQWSDLNHLFESSLMLKTEFNIGLSATLTVQSIYNNIYNDYMVQPQFKYNFGNGLNIQLNADLFGSNNNGGFFSYFKDNNRFQCKLKYDF